MNVHPEKKLAGLLVPVFCLRGNDDLGIGDTGSLRELLAWAARNSIGAIQILPVNESGSDHSPYNLLSAMAIDPLTIETRPGPLPGLTGDAFHDICSRHDLKTLRSGRVDYCGISALKQELLESAFDSLRQKLPSAFRKFEKVHADWLGPYAFHRALTDFHDGAETGWPEEHQSPASAQAWLEALPLPERREFLRRIRFRSFVQWVAFTQWQSLRKEAEHLGVALIGDLPVGVSLFSADTWAHPDIFDLQRSSGAPPEKIFKSDPFTEQWGQNWGFPLYDWQAMSRDNFAWWRRRMRAMLSLFHLIRADHALGFFRIYSFPWRPEDNARFIDLTPEDAAAITGGPLPGFVDFDDDSEEHREHNQRHGEMVFGMFSEECEPFRILAEDLGEVAPYVRPTLKKLGVPGFKIPQWERHWDRLTPGSEYPRLSVTTFATHDHPPIRAFWEELVTKAESPETRDAAIHEMWEFMDFCGHPDQPLPQPFTGDIHRIFLHGLLASNAWLAIHMITDLFGTSDRINIPGSSATENWSYRIAEPIAQWDAVHSDLLRFFQQSIRDTGRAP